MSLSLSSLPSLDQPLITDPRVLHLIANSHIQAPTACFVTAGDTVIAVNDLALQALGRRRGEVVAHLATEFDSSTAEKESLPTVITGRLLVEDLDPLDTSPVVKIVPIEGTGLKVYWLRGPSPKGSRSSGALDLSRASSFAKLSPQSERDSPLRRLPSVADHLSGNALTKVLEGQSEAIQRITIEAYRAQKQIREHVSFIENLELNHEEIRASGTGYLYANESVDNVKSILRRMFLGEELASDIIKVVITTRSLDSLDKNGLADWKRVSYVISQILQNACKHGGHKVRLILDIEYDPLCEMLKIFIQDDGPGMNQGYLSEALDGITFTEDAKAPTSKPGIILRICRLLVEDVLKGQFRAITNSAGTAFELCIGVKSIQELGDESMKFSSASRPIEIGDIELHRVAGAGSGCEGSSVIHSEYSAFRRIPSSLKLDDCSSFDPSPMLMNGRRRREGYFQLPRLESNLVSLETILELQSFKENASHLTDRDALLPQRVKLPLNAPILHVDDEKSGQMVLSRFMKQCNLTSSEVADSGGSALEKVQEAITSGKPYQMIFMDQMLGGVIEGLDRGTNVARKIFEIYKNFRLPPPIIIPASGNMTKEDVVIYKAAGMSCEVNLEKPFRPEQIRNIVARYFASP